MSANTAFFETTVNTITFNWGCLRDYKTVHKLIRKSYFENNGYKARLINKIPVKGEFQELIHTLEISDRPLGKDLKYPRQNFIIAV